MGFTAASPQVACESGHLAASVASMLVAAASFKRVHWSLLIAGFVAYELSVGRVDWTRLRHRTRAACALLVAGSMLWYFSFRSVHLPKPARVLIVAVFNVTVGMFSFPLLPRNVIVQLAFSVRPAIRQLLA